MYNFIFYFVYKSQVNQKDGGPAVARIIASMIIFITLVIQIGLIYSIARFLLFNFQNNDISFSTKSTYTGKFAFWLPFFIAIYIAIYRWYNRKRIIKTLNRYSQIDQFYSLYNIVKFLILIFFPLIIAIWLVNHSQVHVPSMLMKF